MLLLHNKQSCVYIPDHQKASWVAVRLTWASRYGDSFFPEQLRKDIWFSLNPSHLQRTVNGCHNFLAGSRQTAGSARICETSLFAHVLAKKGNCDRRKTYHTLIPSSATVCRYVSLYLHLWMRLSWAQPERWLVPSSNKWNPISASL